MATRPLQSEAGYCMTFPSACAGSFQERGSSMQSTLISQLCLAILAVWIFPRLVMQSQREEKYIH